MLLRYSLYRELFTLALIMGGVVYAANAQAEVWADVRDNVITNNGVFDCAECHSYLKNIAGNSSAALSRHSAPSSVDFDGSNDLNAYINSTAALPFPGVDGLDTTWVDNTEDRIYERASNYVASGLMPYDPTADADMNGVIDDFAAAADLSPGKMVTLLSWALQGAPYNTVTVSTTSVSTKTKLTGDLRASFNPNVHSGTAVEGALFFEYGTSVAYGSTSSTSNYTGTSAVTRAIQITGLKCGTQYFYRAKGSNGDGAVTAASGSSFTTNACTDPVITGVTIVADATDQSTDEDTFKEFVLAVTDDDPGSLQWSKTNGSKGAVTLSGTSMTAFSGSATVLYTPTANSFGADAFTVTVNNMSTGTSHVVTFNMAVTGINDQPVITSTASTSAIEDIQYSYPVVVDDADDTFVSGLSIALVGAPAGMAVDPATGIITWTPMNGVPTSGLVTVNVDDGKENGTAQVTQQFTVGVTAINDPPVITPGATTTATEDVQYSYQMQVTDIDDSNNGTDIGFTFTSKPAGMAISNTGLITWTPLEGVASSGVVAVEVEDGNEDTSAPDSESFTIAVTQVNDSPVVTPGAVTTANEEDNYSYQIVVNDDDDLNNESDLTFTPTNFPTGMAVSNTGLITWLVPRTGAATSYNNITVTVTDGGEDAATGSVEIFTLAVSITDVDGDLVADYADNCPGNANGIAEDSQADNDGDTQYIANAGFPAAGDVDASDPAKGGDACDTDDDNDGMTDVFENMFAFLDPMNASDAAADEDGDGVSNLDEFFAGTAPDVDSVGPTVNAPADITVDATGLLTAISLGAAIGDDGNDGESTLFKAAVDLTQAEKDALAVATSGCQLFSDYETDIEPFRPGKHTVTWATCDSSGNSGQDDQTVNVKPLVSVTSGQSVGEGQAVSINVVLNGAATDYANATVRYTLTGTAIAVDDHDGVSGAVTFAAPGEVGVITFNTINDGVTESDETVIVTLHTPSNMALSNSKVHTVTITEANVVPQVALKVTQPGAVLDVNKGNTLYQPDGVARVVANANDGNGDALSFDWTASDASLLAIATTAADQIDFDPNALTVGNFYKVVVTVSDGNAPVTVERLLLVKAGEANAWLVTDDDDGDGKFNLAEGYGDEDGDGIPNYIDNDSTPPNAIENHTVNLETSLYIETDPGLKIVLGETAVAAQASGVQIGKQDIVDHGGAGGIAVTNAATDYTFLSSVLNFEISGLTDDVESVHVVIPLLAGIQGGSVYRKYNSSGWFDFVEDDLNELRSAAGNDGSCPQPGSNLYSTGLTVGHLCLQLTIQDGGANDADGVRNFIVKDPGGLALAPEPEEVADNSAGQASGRIGSVSLWFMLMLLITATVVWRLRVRAAVK